MFTPRAARIPIAADAAQRQGRAATLAWEAFGDGGAARAFLNDHHAELGGRPIDLATASAEGLAIVSAALAERTGGQA